MIDQLDNLTARFDKDKVNITISDRTYCMSGAFPSSIQVGDMEILAAPIGLRAKFDGQEEPWDLPHTVFVSNDGEQLVYTAQQAAGNTALNARIKVEQDGLIWIDMMMIPFGRWITYHRQEDLTLPRLNSLKLEIPLTTEAAELYHYWPILSSGIDQTAQINNSGAVPAEGFAIPLKPTLWLGKEECGLAFYMESMKNAQPADPEKFFCVRREGNAVILSIDLLDSMPKSWQNRRDSWSDPLEPVEFSFGMQATPVKPYKRLKDFEHVMCREWYDLDHFTDEEMDQYAAELESLGVKWHSMHEAWTMIQNYGLSWDEDYFRKLVNTLHRHGIKVMAYFGYEFSTMVPSWFEKKDLYLLKAANGRLRGGWQRLPHQRDYMVCYAGGYSEEVLERVAHVLDDYGVDGIYTDGTYVPWECANEAHGCGYRDENGVLHETYPMRKVREHVKKLYKIVHDRGGIIEAHMSSCCAPMLLAFADTYFDGEHIQELYAENTAEIMNTAAMRSEFSGHNFGLPFQFLSNTDTYLKGCGIMLLHNAVTKVYGDNPTARLQEAAVLWKIMDDFGADDARFVGYWKDECPVHSDTEHVLASAWIGEKGILIVIVNLTGKQTAVHISVGEETRELIVEPLIPYFEIFSEKG